MQESVLNENMASICCCSVCWEQLCRVRMVDMDQTKRFNVCETNRQITGVLFILTRHLIKTARSSAVRSSSPPMMWLLCCCCSVGGRKMKKKKREGHGLFVCLKSIPTGGRQDGVTLNRTSSLFLEADRSMNELLCLADVCMRAPVD